MIDCRDCPDPGMCCRYLELPLARELTHDERNWVNLHQHASMPDSQTIHFNTSCIALKDGRCTIYDMTLRPQMCSTWPDRPEEQTPQGCLYRKQEVTV